MTKKLEQICIISGSYPTPTSPKYTFVDQLVSAWADLGIDCIVISPNSITKQITKRSNVKPREWSKTTLKGNTIKIYSPNYLSYSSRNLLGYNTANLTIKSFKQSVFKEFRRLNLKPDIIYGHFIVSSGIAAAEIGSIYNIPSFFAYGESSPEHLEKIGVQRISNMLKNINGVVSVSTENKKRLIERKIVSSEKVKVFPNAIDSKLFYKRDKQEMRRKFGYSESDFIVAFVGHFINRKGSLRVSRALDGLNGIKSIFIGNGPDFPTCEGILHSGRVPHEKIPEMLSAADVFVLPTLNEGCCNAIVEAMACGLPIISSDKPFNDDVLTADNSIRVDPMNVEQIRNAIKLLKNDTSIRMKMSEASIIHAVNFKIEERAKRILNFMQEKIQKK
ncbi:glycosyltransferase [Ammoniphilus sp. CFH 90114]|uniref:glycosyltransferase n=1 Tax=Ammoniphilus sp. CFH 90114 TaxID=2493665 RepID=UPI00100F50E5|nr:glycosyltransferase [Ammoniphilus sp. CFH 90114]RXT03672.1 glycosyltransferase family 4 protein [Ammoniphilus sp. CFH 90114]